MSVVNKPMFHESTSYNNLHHLVVRKELYLCFESASSPIRDECTPFFWYDSGVHRISKRFVTPKSFINIVFYKRFAMTLLKDFY